jgi:hypothetical protein
MNDTEDVLHITVDTAEYMDYQTSWNEGELCENLGDDERETKK